MAAVVGAEPGQHAAGPALPVADQRSCRRLEEDEAQQVALARAIEPADEEPGSGAVPGPRAPAAVEQVGRAGEAVDRRRHRRGRRFRRLGRGRGRVAPAGQLEQIGPFGARQPQGERQAGERRRRGRHGATLLQPAVPGGADGGELRQLLPPEARGAAARALRQPDGRGRQPLALGAQEGAERMPTIVPARAGHGSSYTRIKDHSVPV